MGSAIFRLPGSRLLSVERNSETLINYRDQTYVARHRPAQPVQSEPSGRQTVSFGKIQKGTGRLAMISLQNDAGDKVRLPVMDQAFLRFRGLLNPVCSPHAAWPL